MRLNRGLVFMADTRTNAGVDNFSTTRKLFTWDVPGERKITIMTAGNLATTQAMISLLEERSKTADQRDPSIFKQPTMFQVAALVGSTLKEVINNSMFNGQMSSDQFSASVILGGQVGQGKPTIFMIYPEGNFIEVSDDTPYMQIGETKYGKPILVRAYDADMTFEDAVKLLIVSFDSTVKSNLSVGLPFDLEVYEKNSFSSKRQKRIDENDPIYKTISTGWGDALKEAFQHLPSYQL